MPNAGASEELAECDEAQNMAAVGAMCRLAVEDVGNHRVFRSGREGLLTTDNAAGMPQCVRAQLGQRFNSFCAVGDGCGVHACLGRQMVSGSSSALVGRRGAER